MYEENRILSKIEQWVDKLPYKTAEIRIEMADKTYTLTKDKKRPIGFQSGGNDRQVNKQVNKQVKNFN